MSLLFYFFSLIVVWTEIYFVFNKVRLERNFVNKDLQSVTKSDFFYYLFRLIFFIWLVVGIWSSFQNQFIIILSLNLLKFPIFHVSRRIFAVYDNVLPTINILAVLIILFFRVFS